MSTIVRPTVIYFYRAVQGTLDTTFAYCASTSGVEIPWWTVDLQDTYVITDVTITNRGDCCRKFKQILLDYVETYNIEKGRITSVDNHSIFSHKRNRH